MIPYYNFVKRDTDSKALHKVKTVIDVKNTSYKYKALDYI